MGDREAEPSCSGIDLRYTERRGPDVNENQFRLTIDGRCIVALGALGLAAFYLCSPENKAKVVATLSNALERVGDKIGNITSGSLVVVLHCSSSKRFLRFWEDYRSGSVKRRLSEEFSKIGIEGITVQIENEEQVIKKSEVIRYEMSKESGSSEKPALVQASSIHREKKIEYEQTVTINTTGWTSRQRQRLAVEKSILEKYFPSCVTWISPASVNAKIDVFVKCNSGTQYTLRVYIPHDFPNSCPNMVIKEPESLIPDFPDRRRSRFRPRNHEGYLLICHSNVSKWSTAITLFEVFVKGQLWLEAYEDHLPWREIEDTIFAKHSLCTPNNYKMAA